MLVPITKIQILSDNSAGHPLFYCHAADQDHDPELQVRSIAAGILVECRDALYKVKENPQRKNRVDIYMPLTAARDLGRALTLATPDVVPQEVRQSNADPNANAGGRMKLPKIIWSKYVRYVKAAARLHSGTLLEKENGYVNIDLEEPHETHIKMTDREIHIGVTLSRPKNQHDASKTTLVHVPDGELQQGTGETNPIAKVRGDFYFLLSPEIAAGLGALLSRV